MSRAALDHPSIQRAISFVRRFVPTAIWNRIAMPYRDWRFARDSRTGWLTRRDATDGHVAMYWNSLEHPNRRALIDTLATCIAEFDPETGLEILEFGCHAGMNFRLLHDRFSDRRLHYYGVEPNRDAARFLRSQLPFVELLEAEDARFVASDFPSREGVDVSFVNVVLYSVVEARAKRVIEKLCRISDVIVIGEQLANTTASSRFREDPKMYEHPYTAWMRQFGFTDLVEVPAPEPSPQLGGFLIARRPSQH